MSVELSSRHRRLVEDILRSRAPGLRVMVFGSRARGGSVSRSDLDLLVEGDTPVDDALLAQLSLDFADSDLPFRVEIVDAARLDAAFRRRIEADLSPLAEPSSSIEHSA